MNVTEVQRDLEGEVYFTKRWQSEKLQDLLNSSQIFYHMIHCSLDEVHMHTHTHTQQHCFILFQVCFEEGRIVYNITTSKRIRQCICSGCCRSILKGLTTRIVH